jgi:hypothetical protein
VIRISDFCSNSVENCSEVVIKAGRSYAVPVSIEFPDFVLSWQFTTLPKVCYSILCRVILTEQRFELKNRCCNVHLADMVMN